ncbi:MAG TPA: HNH endonuclease signature motif containing protein [Bdellovibrionota bacterium]|jgi:hypothetical protein|nr:HNH endonuclease signature motif containing protein [Bdellovibrionota bacterium]
MNTLTFIDGWREQVASLSDQGLLEAALRCARSEREQTAALVAHLSEVCRRDLALKRGYASLFKYAREALGLTDSMAWERVSAARLALQVPETIDRLLTGELTLAAAGELWKCLQNEKRAALGSSPSGKPSGPTEALALQPSLIPAQAPAKHTAPSGPEVYDAFAQILGKTRRESEAVLQEWRRERNGTRAEESGAPSPRPASRRNSHSRSWTECSFFLGAEELALFDRLRDLLSHKLGTRDPQAVFQWLLQKGLDQVDPLRREARIQKRKQAKQKRAHKDAAPQCLEQEAARPVSLPASAVAKATQRKPISAPLRRRVWIRDKGRCQHTDPLTGRQCDATGFLDLDHVVPVSQGGENLEENLRVSCANHNRRRFRWDERDQPTG